MTSETVRDRRAEVELPMGTIRYREAGAGPVLVFVHGYLVDGRLWAGVVDALSDRFRCIAPDWPLGAHRQAMDPDADLSPYGVAATIAAFLEALDVSDATIVGNDSGGAMSQVLASRHPERIGRLVLTNCDCYEHFPPSAFKALPPLAGLPGGMALASLPFRVPAIARRAYAVFARRPIPDQLIESWLFPGLHDREVRRDLAKVTAGMRKRYTIEAASKLRDTGLPLLLAWAPGDRYFPLSDARRLAADAAEARIVEIADSSTFVPLDQPIRLAEEIAAFVP